MSYSNEHRVMNINQIKEYAQIKNLELLWNYPQSTLPRNAQPTDWEFESDWCHQFQKVAVGVEIKKGVFFWWEVDLYLLWNEEPKAWEVIENEPLNFSHRYNTANGAIQKSFSKGWAAELDIQRIIEQQSK